MKFIYTLIYFFLPIFCFGQSEYIIIGELRYGEDASKAILYDEGDGIILYQIDANGIPAKNKLDAYLTKKEQYYKKKDIGTEIRIPLNKKALGDKNEIKIKGGLFTHLNYKKNKERISGYFRNTLRLSLEQCDKIGPSTLKLKNPIKIKDPAKFSIAKKIQWTNALLYEQDSLSEYYADDVNKILSLNEKEQKKLKPNFLSKCYEIYGIIEPNFNNDSYISFENVELDEHILQLKTDIDAYKNGTYSGAKTIDSLERDLFESEIVEESFDNLKLRMGPLYSKLNEILFNQKNEDSSEESCKKNVDFNLALGYSLGGNFNRFELVDSEINATGSNDNAFNLTAMTNLYPFGTGQVNLGLGIGVGINIFDKEFKPNVFFGTVIAFGKKKNLAFNIGFSYAQIECLNPSYQLPITLPEGLTEDDIIGVNYRWKPAISFKLPFNLISQ